MTMNRIRFPLILTLLLVLLMMVGDKYVKPFLVDAAWRVLPVGYAAAVKHPLDYLHWHGLAFTALLALIGFPLVALVTTHRSFFERYVREATPESLGWIRIVTCGILLTSTVWEDLASSALLPAELRHPMGVMQFFYAVPMFDRFAAGGEALTAFKWLTASVLFLGMIGCWTRVVIPSGALCYLLLGGTLRSYSHLFHTGLLPLYLMAILMWTPCGDGWSFDRLWRRYRSRPVPLAGSPSPIYGWSRYACWLTIALAYEAAGLSKLRNGGLFWWDATNIRALLYWGSLNPMPFDWGLSLRLSSAPDILFALLGIVVLLFELSFVLVLFSSTARRILPAAAVMVHVGIWFLQNILFFDFILLQLVFLDLTAIQKALAQRLAARGRIHVLFDGACPLCRRTVRLLLRLDLFERLEFIDFRQLDLMAYNRRYGLDLTLGDLAEEMHVVSRGRVYRGFCGYRRIALVLPALWSLAPWLFFPGVSSLGALAYRYVATQRLLALTCDSRCGTEPAAESGSPVTLPNVSASRSRLYALGVSVVVVVALVVWLNKIEFYPITAWQMYSGYSRSVEYYKVLARDESGVTSRAYFERALPAVTDNRFVNAIRMCFRPGTVPTCEMSLRAVGSAINKRAAPGHRVTAFVIQIWSWDFRSNPSDPAHGTLVDSYLFRDIDMASPTGHK